MFAGVIAPSGRKTTPAGTLRSIQILRAVAALAVVYYHAVDVPAGGVFGLPSTGSWGVDVFFVISGFIIGLVLTRNSSHFFLRRVFRIIPLYWTATVCWSVAVLLMPAYANSTEVTPIGLLQSFFFIPYWMSTRPGPILYLGWTLMYEMFFYVVVALALLVFRRAVPTLVATAVLLGALVLLGAVWPTPWYQLAYFQAPVILEFLFGLLLFVLWSRGEAALRAADGAVRRIVFVLAAALLIAGLVWLARQDPNAVSLVGFDRVLRYGIASLAVVGGALLLEPLVRDGAITRWLLVLGSASYAIYLFHPLVLGFFSRVLFAGAIGSSGVMIRLLLLLVTLLAVALSSIVIDRYYDQPIQRALKRRFLR